MKLRLTARARLTVLYTGLVLAAGLVLTGLTYLFMRRRLEQRLVRIDLRGPDGTVETAPRPEDLLPDLDRLQDATLHELLIQALIALTVVTALAALLGWLVAGRVLRPIRAISATAQRLSAETCRSGFRSTSPATNWPRSPRRSTACSTGSRPGWPARSCSPPTPRTSCAPR